MEENEVNKRKKNGPILPIPYQIQYKMCGIYRKYTVSNQKAKTKSPPETQMNKMWKKTSPQRNVECRKKHPI